MNEFVKFFGKAIFAGAMGPVICFAMFLTVAVCGTLVFCKNRILKTLGLYVFL